MKTIYTYYKNSNTGEFMMSQKFTETDITGIPVYFYGFDNMEIGQDLSLKSFVNVSKKKYDRERKKYLNKTKTA